ncbi:transglutaminase-like protein [Caenibius tardaugens NBRC 16725]|uniref:Transglutaminase-like protein n=1 Tax=Caenibius tardaugens NBRC 16725 TaxID=1219035 RepID=U2YJJ6_9SPHN|nr:transglutaminase family protein [Caenibius tardaugens]AZI36267.1 transglutaminase family protein [Caenibius tardaugens NBRC 16725]GAD48620.1 transglutaminase-like protein [Caenibius tardaugens NBRC 16725]
MIYQVNHTSRVRYGAPVDLARFAIRLKPASWPGQTLLSYHMDVSPVPTHLAEEFGPYQVNNTLVSIDERLQELVVTSVFRMEVTPPPGIVDDGTDIATVRSAALRVGDIATFAPAPFLYGSRVVELEPEIGAWAASMLGDTAGIVPAIRALCSKIHAEFTYLPGVTDSDTPPLEAFRARHGVCQDFAHVMIAALRWYGIPAAYVSGYLRTEPPPGRPRLVGADAMHAWVNVWCGPRLGWVAIDPTNDRMVDQDYVTVAMGRDYADIAPVDGVFVGTPVQKMTTGVDVIPEA